MITTSAGFETGKNPSCKYCGIQVTVGQPLCPTCRGWALGGFLSDDGYHSYISGVLPFKVGDVLITVTRASDRLQTYLVASAPLVMLHRLKKNITVSKLRGDLRWDRGDLSEEGCNVVSFEFGITRDRLSVLRGSEMVYRNLNGFVSDRRFDFTTAERYYGKRFEKVLTLAKSL
jgi:hypothetical protein